MIITLNAGKAFDKIQHSFMFKKKLSETKVKGNFLNLIKGIYEKPTL